MCCKTYLLTQRWNRQLGGVENWAAAIYELVAERGPVEVFAFREVGVLKALKRIFSITDGSIYLLMDYRMLLFAPLVLVSAIFKRIDIVIFLHGDEILKLGISRRIILVSLQSIYRIKYVANSNYTSHLFSKLVPFANVSVVYPFDKYREKQLTCTNINQKKLFNSKLWDNSQSQEQSQIVIDAVIVARLVKRKNHESVIRALAVLRELEPALIVNFNIVGSGPLRAKLSRLVDELGLTDVIKFSGSVQDDEKHKVLAAADLFIMPTTYDRSDRSVEGFGISYIEACSFGCPAIYTRNGGAAEAVIDGVTGVCCDGTPKGIAEAVLRAVKIKWDAETFLKHSTRFDSSEQKDFMNLVYGNR